MIIITSLMTSGTKGYVCVMVIDNHNEINKRNDSKNDNNDDENDIDYDNDKANNDDDKW